MNGFFYDKGNKWFHPFWNTLQSLLKIPRIWAIEFLDGPILRAFRLLMMYMMLSEMPRQHRCKLQVRRSGRAQNSGLAGPLRNSN